MRGRRWYTPHILEIVRNTPADAGKTCRTVRPECKRRKHPRGCGEDAGKLEKTGSASETPPRMRGRLLKKSTEELEKRNTPADAGKTPYLTGEQEYPEKHPRGCGEDSAERPRAVFALETPPRMRGRLTDFFESGEKTRNTPADAGKTFEKLERSNDSWKHPRGCGEDACKV